MRFSITSWLYLTSSTGLVSALAIQPRSIFQGWSLQSSTCPTGSDSCGATSGACCPSSLHCGAAANDQVAPCCTANDGNCAGAVENAPICADSSWNLFRGFMGNDFCCQPGQMGVFGSDGAVAGVCISSTDSLPFATTTASLVSSPKFWKINKNI